LTSNHKWSIKIRGKIALGYFMILLLLGLFLLIVSGRINELDQETVFLSGHDMKVHELTYQIEKNVLDMETGQRGYALTGDSEYLSPYNNGLVEWRINYATLHELVSNNPTQVQNLNSIRDNIERWIREAGQHVVDLKRDGQEDAVSTFFVNDSGKPIIDMIREQSELFRDNERILTNNRVTELEHNNDRLILYMYILWAAVALAAAAAAILISRSIVDTLHRVIMVINNIAAGGNMGERIRVNSRDEIYDLAEATNRLLDTVEREQWSSEHINHMSIALQETADLTSLCKIFINKLAAMLELQYGAVFVLNKEEQLERIYTYAGNGQETDSGSFPIKLGEGLVGQCAVDQEMIVLEDLPKDYISINSGLGRSAPRYAVIAPVIFESRTVAVVEAASLTKWAPYHFDLLNHLLTLLSVTVNSVITRMEIQTLYTESQAMNEELQVQSEELQVQSEELQSHSSELMVLNGELETQKAIAVNTALELEKYNVQLEESSRYKSEFLANMSHELRTPLNSMLILSQLLAENRNETLTEEEQEYAEIIHNSGSELLGLIDDILDLSKVEAGKMIVEMDAVNITEFPSLLTGYFGKTAERKNLQFSVAIGPGVPDIFYTDELRLHQIMRNLLSNAFKFTEKGGVKVEITKRDSIHTKHFVSETPVLAFAVQDSGIGISEEKSDLIFEAFRQADGSTVRKFGGTGLGLSISLQLARLLKGHITVESTPGTGSIFTLFLPCRENDTALEETESEAWAEASAARETMPETPVKSEVTEEDYRNLQGKTVLLVDDDSRNLFSLRQGLAPYDMNILSAQSGYECLQVLREHPEVDIVLLDIMMPNLDGNDTMSIIREELKLTELPIIAISAKTMKEDREKCYAAGATDFIGKPAMIKDVIYRMCRWIRET
jgi:two-component system, chemotaxis family, sensor kinase CheA